MTTLYRWTVRFLHKRNSFQKTVTVAAGSYTVAVAEAAGELFDQGYEKVSEDFEVVEVRRGTSA